MAHRPKTHTQRNGKTIRSKCAHRAALGNRQGRDSGTATTRYCSDRSADQSRRRNLSPTKAPFFSDSRARQVLARVEIMPLSALSKASDRQKKQRILRGNLPNKRILGAEGRFYSVIYTCSCKSYTAHLGHLCACKLLKALALFVFVRYLICKFYIPPAFSARLSPLIPTTRTLARRLQ